MSLTARLIAVLVLFAAISAGLWKVYHTGYVRGSGDVQAEYQAKALEAERQARAAEQAKTDALAAVDAKHQKELAHVKADHDAAIADLDSLLAAVSSSGAVPQDAASASRSDDTSRTRYVLGQCTATLSKLAETADTIEARMTGLQDYIKTVCLK